MTYSAEVTIPNGSDAEACVWIEPWGNYVTVPAGAEVRVVGYAAQPGAFQVDHGRPEVTVWAWPSATVRCFVGADEVGHREFLIPVPGLPPGTSTSQFLGLALGPKP